MNSDTHCDVVAYEWKLKPLYEQHYLPKDIIENL